MTATIDDYGQSTLSYDEVRHVSTPGLSESWLSTLAVPLVQPWPLRRESVDPTERSLRKSLAGALARLVDLDHDWDGHGALKPSGAALGLARRVLAVLAAEVPDPSVSPSTDGGVLLEWDAKGVELLLAVSASSIEAVAKVDNHEVEGDLRSMIEDVATALAQLSRRS